MDEPRTRRLRGPYVVIAFLLLASAGAVGGWFMLRQRPKPADIVDVLNLDGERAVLVREVRGRDEHSFVSLYDHAQGERWGALVPEYPEPGARSGVAATQDVVLVRGIASGQAVFFAFSGRSGQKLGRIEPYLGTREPADTGFVLERGTSLFDGGQVFDISGVAGQWVSVLAFAVRDGTLTWRADLGPVAVERVWLQPGHLIIMTTDDVLVLDRASGQVGAPIPGADPACVVEDTLYTRDAAGRILARPLARPAEFRAIPVSARLAGLCGRTDTHTLLAVQGSGAAVIAFDQSDAVVWRLPLPGGVDARVHLDPVALTTPAAAAFSGRLARFVPVLVSAAPDQHRQLLVIDTLSGRIAASGRPSPWLADAHLMSADGRHHLYLPGPRILAVLDGRTGELGHARALPGWSGVWPRQIAGGRIWITRGSDFAVLDAASLEPVPGPGPTTLGDSARDAVLAELGI